MRLIEGLFLKLVGFLERRGGRKEVPLHIEFSRGQQFGHIVALVEGLGFSDPRGQFFRHGSARFVVFGIVIENRRIDGPVLIELRGKFDEVARR